MSVTPVQSPHDGSVARLLAVSSDVTEERQLEQALRASGEQKDKFIATLAHELRNPLAPIRNAVALLGKVAPSAEKFAWCREVIDRQVGQMTRLLDDLLDVSRVTRAKLTLRRERLDVRQIAEHAIEIGRPIMDETGLTFRASLPAEPVYVDGDLTRLAQALSNLLINAAKYTPPGGQVALRVSCEQSDVLIRVSDTGIGIPAGYLEEIFEMFCQIPSATKHSHGGLGIGLALAKGLVELHGGTLTASSAGEGAGSEFVLRLPIQSEPRPRPDARSEAASPALLASRASVLVVDDLRDSADTLGMLLQSMGHDVRVAYDGAEALRMAEAFRPEAVFVDLGMPTMDGYEVCRRIRASTWGSKILVSAQTGWGQQIDRRRTEAAGFDDHMVKPLDPDHIDRFLRRLTEPARTALGSSPD